MFARSSKVSFVLTTGVSTMLGSCQTSPVSSAHSMNPSEIDAFVVTKASVAAGSSITWNGETTSLSGQHQIRIGLPFPKITLLDSSMKNFQVPLPGKVTILNSIPSVDTPVCERQSHIVGETTAVKDGIERVMVSVDLPYALRRFSKEAKLSKLTFLSDYKTHDLANAAGIRIDRNDLLARAVFVIDQNGIVRYMQIVPEITNLPDLDTAFAFANSLLP